MRRVDHANGAVSLGRSAFETWYEPPRTVEDRLDAETPSPVDETNLAVERHARHTVAQRICLLELRLDEPATIGARQAPQLVPLYPADRRIVLVKPVSPRWARRPDPLS